MATRNDITGDKIQTKAASKAYEDNYDAIFRKEPCPVCDKDLKKVTECAWTSCPKVVAEWNESRMDIIGQNGNDGDHYGVEGSSTTSDKPLNSTETI